MMTFQLYGDNALLINFEQKIDSEINAQVISLANTIEKAAIPGVTFSIPAYCSLTVGFDPSLLKLDDLCDKIKTLSSALPMASQSSKKRLLKIPVCYEDAFGLDFPEVMKQTGLPRQEIIALHTQRQFRVFMLGFLPGFAYLGTLPQTLYCSRMTTPRLRVPAQSVGLAGYQTGIYPSEAPGGWQIIGRTPIKTFDPSKGSPFLLQAGDIVQFHAISVKEYLKIDNDISSNTFNWNSIYE
ncbi:5-oxoprolinase subunit PxpB [Xanthovirga aplysinae]|uniref:5-oxoprolinase subunit PxpB n=1 Tax=Xanthovirga aplysinae TaxID=2529853 RepID=UPI0012BC32BA|nr:5-oxoprolinase subunit PxpB [Xanthovirga aplysinae]MTI30760.1 5-oxoprolinase subunit PxpB [Xanthovirga aplysinae]